MYTKFYDKNGVEITIEQWSTLNRDIKYKHLRETTLEDGKWISTVWLGMDHNFSNNGLPIIFETMVFDNRKNLGAERDCNRYSTLEDALAGHDEMVLKWNSSPEVRFEWDNMEI